MSKFISSDLEYEKSIFKMKKCVDTQRMLDEIVDNIRKKKIESQDLSLLKVAGLEDIIEILKIKEQYQLKIRGMGHEVKEEDIWKEGINLDDLRDIMENDLNFPK